jgi:hypothetical protein
LIIQFILLPISLVILGLVCLFEWIKTGHGKFEITD